MSDSTATEMTDEQQSNMRKVALTALAGTSIEWYDYFLYGTAAALIFPTAFFPADMSPTVALIASFSTASVGFVARPLGGIVFGHFGDQIGRKKALVTALMIMGVCTTLIGFLPTYAAIGAAAPLLLCVLRFVQGFAIGGQWGGAMLLVTESAPANKRGYYGAYAQAGAPVGVILANAAFLAISYLVSPEFFLEWGWRIPFLSSIVLIAVSLYIQLHLEDTPAFKELEALKEANTAGAEPTAPIKKSPILEALRRYPKRISLAAGAFLSIQVTFYILIGFVIAYGTNEAGLGLTRETMLGAILIGSLIQIPAQFWAAGYSDRNGRKGIYIVGAVLSGIWAFAIFPLMDTGSFLLIVLAVTGGLVFLGFMYGPQAAFFTELFSTEVRYSGASLGYQIGAILGGALAAPIATFLWAEYGTLSVSIYIAGAAVLTLISVFMLTETFQTDLSEEQTE